jgi:hypothetical protein
VSNYNKNTRNKNKKILFSAFIIIVGLAGVFLVLRRDSDVSTQQKSETNPETISKSVNETNMSKDKESNESPVDTETEKDDLPSQEETSTEGDASLVITRAEQYSENIEVSAYVRDIFEDGGVCKATFTYSDDNSLQITKDTMGIKDVSETICPTFIVPRDEFTKLGNWKVVVSYIAIDGTKFSAEKTFEVQ